jgi:predicted dehydrogenase
VTPEPVGIGFIGHSWMARVHGHAIQTIGHVAPLRRDIQLVNIAGRDSKAVERHAQELGFVRWTTDWRAVIADPDVDVVAVLSPIEHHEAAASAALQAGKAVLCEKPLAGDAAEAGRMLHAARSSGALAACGFNYRFVPAVRLARELITSGRLGDLHHFRATYLQDWARSPDVVRSWRFSASRPSNGAVGDYSHLLDLMRYLAGEPRSVSAAVARFIGERPDPEDARAKLPVATEDAYAAVLHLTNGALATLEASRCATGWKGRQRVEANGSAGSLWWDMEDLNRLHVYFVEDDAGGLGGFRDVLVTERDHPFLGIWWAPGHILGWEHTFVHQWRELLEAFIEQRPLSPDQASFDDGYRAAVICDAILSAAATERTATIA